MEGEVEFSCRAYAKIVLHCAKYPHCAVNGVLLARGGDSPAIADAVPLFHQIQGLTPMLEVALAQVELAAASAGGLTVAGFYHANENFGDVSVDVFSLRVAERVAESRPNGSPGAVLATVNNRKLGGVMEEPALVVSRHAGSEGGKWRQMKQVRWGSMVFLQLCWHNQAM